MAVIKIWAVLGRMSHSLGTVIEYIENPEKTGELIRDDRKKKYTKKELQSLENVMEYAMDESKTEKQFYVNGVNCDPKFARDQMIMTKERFGKTEGRICYHMIQSFAPGEVTPELAHEIGIRFAQEIFGDKYEVLVATHLNTDSIHNHFVINSVSMDNGKKYHMPRGAVYKLRNVSNRLCREHGLSEIQDRSGGGKYSYYDLLDFKHEGGSLNIFAHDIDEAIASSVTRQQFFDEMSRRGYRFDFTRQHPRIFFPGKERARRWETLAQVMGDAYSQESVYERIAGNWTPEQQPEQDDARPVFFGGERPTYSFHHYRKVYVYFISGLKFVRARPRTNRELYFLLGDELRKLDRLSDQERFLIEHGLDTSEDVIRFRTDRESELNAMTEERNSLRMKLQTAVRAGDEDKQLEVKGDVAKLSEKIREARHDVRMCDRIMTDAERITEKLSIMDSGSDSANNIKRKETVRDDTRSRRR